MGAAARSAQRTGHPFGRVYRFNTARSGCSAHQWTHEPAWGKEQLRTTELRRRKSTASRRNLERVGSPVRFGRRGAQEAKAHGVLEYTRRAAAVAKTGARRRGRTAPDLPRSDDRPTVRRLTDRPGTSRDS